MRESEEGGVEEGPYLGDWLASLVRVTCQPGHLLFPRQLGEGRRVCNGGNRGGRGSAAELNFG